MVPVDAHAVARSLAVDAQTREVSSALAERGVEHVLLKGPSIARWLYAAGEVRPYDDTDLLVPPDRLPDARAVLRELGYSYGGQAPDEAADLPAGLGWVRGAFEVDLHTTLTGARAQAEEAWAVLSQGPEELEVAGHGVRVLRPDLRAMHVVLHAAQHGFEMKRPMDDLDRLLARPDVEWTAVCACAQRLEALDAFAAGLRLRPRGAAIAEDLRLPEATSRRVLLRARSASPLALGLEELSGLDGWRAKVRRLAREVAPSPRFMRLWLPLARRGPLGLAAAYAWRPVYLALRAPRALVSWRSVRSGHGSR